MPRRGCKKTWRRLKALEGKVAEQRQREARQAEALEAEIARRVQQQQQHVGHLELEVATLRDQLPRPVPPQPEPEPDDIDMILEEARVMHFVSGACHLVLGDSIARDAKLKVAVPDTLNLSTGGNNFRRLASAASEVDTCWFT